MSEAVVVTDREGRLLDSNRTADRTFGIDASMLARPVEDVLGREAGEP